MSVRGWKKESMGDVRGEKGLSLLGLTLYLALDTETAAIRPPSCSRL